MDGIGDKDQHRLTLASSHPDGVGVVSSGKGNLVPLIVPPPPPPCPPPHQRCFDYSNQLWWSYAGCLWNRCCSLSITGPGTDLGFSFFFFFFLLLSSSSSSRHRCATALLDVVQTKRQLLFFGVGRPSQGSAHRNSE
jgi:hypothetical protein